MTKIWVIYIVSIKIALLESGKGSAEWHESEFSVMWYINKQGKKIKAQKQ